VLYHQHKRSYSQHLMGTTKLTNWSALLSCQAVLGLPGKQSKFLQMKVGPQVFPKSLLAKDTDASSILHVGVDNFLCLGLDVP